ncbi:prepilin peptidase [Candidatus Syntrophocurvum alkaliphilum]|uniref:prepilin peptidase n=1 Tax=Candidatus Syntrophocurvum alkaliphilum TaxID=2293317 RepID=UPI001FAAB35A|nr:A24 family peptidase [Candidatus Syntrophocurvum alkaliphilum]
MVEIITAVCFILIFVEHNLSLNLLIGCLLVSILICSSFTDITTGLIPNRLTYFGVIAGLSLSYFTIGLKESLLGIAFLFGIYLLAAIISQGGLGGGDIKLAAAIGAFTGLKGSFFVFIIASIIGGVWASLLLISKKASLKTAIKFGPILSIAAFIVWMYLEQLINLYMSIILN